MLTKEEREFRQQGIGASDHAKLLTDPLEVYYDKILPVEELDRLAGNSAIVLGNELESFILSETAKKYGVTAHKGKTVKMEGLPILATPDGVVNAEWGIEAKTFGISHPPTKEQWEEWGDPEADEQIVPLAYDVQCQHQMMVMGWNYVILAVLMGGRGIRHYRIDRDQDYIDRSKAHIIKWWNDHIVARVPPAGVPNMKTLGRIPREDKAYIDFGREEMDLVIEYEDLGVSIKGLEQRRDEVKRHLIHRLGDGTQAKLPDNRIFQFRKEAGGFNVDKDRLKSEFPEVWEQVSYPVTRDVARIKKGNKR